MVIQVLAVEIAESRTTPRVLAERFPVVKSVLNVKSVSACACVLRPTSAEVVAISLDVEVLDTCNWRSSASSD